MNRLKAHRLIEGLTQPELGDVLGVSAQTVSHVEQGRRGANFSLAPIGYADSRLQIPNMSEPLHRQRAATLSANTNRAKELLRFGGEVFRELRSRNQRVPALSIDRLPTPASLGDVEDAANLVRVELGVEERGPIQNLTSLVERAGVCLVPLVGLKGIDGMSSWVEDQPVIGMSPTVPGDRFRFSLAHELAHIVLHRQRADFTEDQANRFAGALLFPEADADEILTSSLMLQDFVGLKSAWGVSVAALIYRSLDLGVIDDKRYRALQIQMARWKRKEPGEFPVATGTLLPRMVEVSGGAEGVARETGLNPRHIREVTNWTHLRAA